MKKLLYTIIPLTVLCLFGSCTDFSDEFGCEVRFDLSEDISKRTLSENGKSYSTVFDASIFLDYFTDEVMDSVILSVGGKVYNVTEHFDLKKGGKATLKIDNIAFRAGYTSALYNDHNYTAILKIKSHSFEIEKNFLISRADRVSFVSIRTDKVENVGLMSATMLFSLNSNQVLETNSSIGIEISPNQDFSNSTTLKVRPNNRDDENCSYSCEASYILQPETNYYYRAYHVYNKVYRYGETKQFKTLASTAKITQMEHSEVGYDGGIVNVVLDKGNTAAILQDANHPFTEQQIRASLYVGTRTNNLTLYDEVSVSANDELVFFIKEQPDDSEIYYQIRYSIGDVQLATSQLNTFKTNNMAVDLGLSVLWAKFNNGTYEESGIGNSISFNWDNLPEKWYRTSNKYKWRIPSKSEFQELIDNCVIEKKSIDGVTGYQFVSKINGNSIFIPYNDENYEYWISNYTKDSQGEKRWKLYEGYYDWYYTYTATSWYLQLNDDSSPIIIDLTKSNSGFDSVSYPNVFIYSKVIRAVKNK